MSAADETDLMDMASDSDQDKVRGRDSPMLFNKEMYGYCPCRGPVVSRGSLVF